jgi:hypothetical protein
LPLRFDNFVQEVNLIAILGLLNFCSGYRNELKRATGRGAFDNIQAMVIALHISRSDVLAKGMKAMTSEEVASIAQFPTSEYRPHPQIEGLEISQPTELAPMVNKVSQVLRETGDILLLGGFQSLGTFVIECAKKSKVDGVQDPSASIFVYRVRKSS